MEATAARTSVVEDKIEKFYSSIKSRLLVGEVIARIEAGAEFSFDFLLLLILASIIAFMGLIENSSVVLWPRCWSRPSWAQSSLGYLEEPFRIVTLLGAAFGMRSMP